MSDATATVEFVDQGIVVEVPIGGMPVKIATLVDPDGNVLEIMELAKGATKLPHP